MLKGNNNRVQGTPTTNRYYVMKPPFARNNNNTDSPRRRNFIVAILALVAVVFLINNHRNTGPSSYDEIASSILAIDTTTTTAAAGDTDNNEEENNNTIDKDEQEAAAAAATTTDAAATTDTETTTINEKSDNDNVHRVAGLSCDKYDGPFTKEAVDEMVYWNDIPNDTKFTSPLQHPTDEQYFTMEPDEGGWNNIRMGLETAIGIAVMTGRTLVLPPKMNFYLLWFGSTSDDNKLGFDNFFHIDSIQAEHSTIGGSFKYITFEEFMETVVMKGQLIDINTGEPSFPPNNLTSWDNKVENNAAARRGDGKVLWPWLRSVTTVLEWNYGTCVATFPAERGQEGSDRMYNLLNDPHAPSRKYWNKRVESYTNNPTAVNEPNVVTRLNEIYTNRDGLCVYNTTFQNAKVVHGIGQEGTGFRLLVHFYAFLFFENWKHDLWLKRFVRDHLRYIDQVQCAAARVIEKLRKLASENSNGATSNYDAFHIRRGDFQYEEMRHISAEDIYELNSKGVIQENATVFIATDEQNRTFFQPLMDHYHIYFLNDFTEELGTSISKNYYGMIDQLIASRSDIFFGAYYSTFTGYINRLRGYHSQKAKLPGYELGIINSYYYVPANLQHLKDSYRLYRAIKPPYWAREFPVAWRDIDHDITE